MNLTIEYVKNAKWENEEHTLASCTVKFAEFAEEIPFGAAPQDVYQHTVDVFNMIVSGDAGVVVEYEKPALPQIPVTSTDSDSEG